MSKTFIIAELGINSNGSLDIAEKLIVTAKESGADAVKFQKRNIDKVYTREELDKYRESPWGLTTREQKLGLEFSFEQYQQIDKICIDNNIVWSASAWDEESVEFLKQFDLPFNKIASPRLGHLRLLDKIAQQKKLTYISTGMATMEEIKTAVNLFRYLSCPFELMHCSSQYPMPDENANLSMIKVLRDTFQCNVGYSCHSAGIICSVAAVAIGATSIEKHFTLDRAMYGSDQAASLEPVGFKKMVEYIRVVESCQGDGHKIFTEEELKCRVKLWRDEDVE